MVRECIETATKTPQGGRARNDTNKFIHGGAGMKYDIIVAGVGGQGTLSVSSIIASAAMSEGLAVKQSEVHGMAQRGGAVVTNLRISDRPIASDLIPRVPPR